MANEIIDEKAIFNVARQINSPDARREYLRQVCGDDADLLARLETLLQAYAEQSSFLETPPAQQLSPTIIQPAIEKAGTVIGPYKLRQQIGEGGMGVVYMAEQSKPITRMVALKIIKPGMDTEQVVARFEAERQALAMMDHPNIAKVLDAGATESQRPYFVMELVKGVPITNYCDDHHLTPKERLQLFAQVLHAVQHAHQKGIIHRDIKPSNVLVAEYDQQAVPKVIDFGVAKATSQKLTDKTMFTHFGQLVGTLEYMSPEQAKLNQMDIDTRCDIYSLGVLLYELLTGDTPFDRQRLRSAAFEEMMRIIREEEPPVPSTRLNTSGMLASVSANRSTEPRKLSSFMRGELDWIVMRAMEKERSRRYQTPNAFADDIQRFLNQEAVVARPASSAYRMKKFAQRNWGAVIAGSVIAATLLLGFGTSTWFAIREGKAAAEANQQRVLAFSAKAEADSQRDLAEKAASEEAKQREIAQQREADALAAREAEALERAAAEKERDRVSALNVTIEKHAEQQRRLLYISDMNLVQSAWQADNVSRVLDLLNAHRPQPGQIDLRGFEWHYWNRQCHQDLQTLKLPASLSTLNGQFSVEGLRLAGLQNGTGTVGRTIKVWDTQSGAEVFAEPLALRHSGSTIALGLHSASNRLAVSTLDEEGLLELQMYDIAARASIFSISARSNPDQTHDLLTRNHSLWISDDGALLSLTLDDGEVDGTMQTAVGFWDARTGEKLAMIPLPGPRPSNMTISPDGSRIAMTRPLVVPGGADDAVVITILEVTLNANSEASIANPVTIPLAGPSSLRFSPDGKQLFVSGSPGSSKSADSGRAGAAFDVTSGQRLFSLPDNEPWVAASLSPDGKWLAVSSHGRPRTVKLYSTAGDAEPLELQGHTSRIGALAFDSDSRHLTSAAGNGQIKTWDIAAMTRYQTQHVASVTWLPTRQHFISPDGTRIAKVLSRYVRQSSLDALSPEARKNVVTMCDDRGNVLYQTAELVGPIGWLEFSSDGAQFAACATSPTEDMLSAAQLCVWDTATGAERMTLRLPARDEASSSQNQRSAPGAALSPDGSKLAVIYNLGSRKEGTSLIKTWDIATQQQEWESERIPWLLDDVKFSPDGARIVNVSIGERMSVWDAKAGRLLWSTSDQFFLDIDFSVDGSKIVSYHTHLGEIQVLDTASGNVLHALRVPDFVWAPSRTNMVFSPDSSRLVTSQWGSPTSSASVWDVNRPERELFKLVGHSSVIRAIAISPDNTRIVTSSRGEAFAQGNSGEIKLWDAETAHELLTLPGAAQKLTFNADGTLLLGELGKLEIGGVYPQRWDASPLPPRVEAEQIVEVFTSVRGEQALPLMSEMLARIDADQTLPDETRAIALTLLKGLPREKELKEEAYAIVALPDQRPEEYERALRYLEEACSANPEDAESWSIRGLANYRLGHSTEALAVLTRCQELHDAKKLSLSAEDFTIRAMAQHQLGRIEEARATLEQVRVSASRNELEWRKLLAEAETLLATPQAADQPELWIGRNFMPRILSAVENERGEWADPPQPYLVTKVVADRLWLGKNSIARSQVVPVDEAVRYYTNVIQADPQNALAYCCRGNLSGFFLGNLDQAIADYSEAIRLSPTSSTYVNNRAYVWLEQKKDLDKALTDFDEALRISPTDSSLHIDRGRVRLAQGELDDALASFDKAIELTPNSGLAYAWRAYVWSAKGDREKMLQDFNQAIQLTPDESPVWTLRAWLLATSPNAEHRDGKQAVSDGRKACELTGWTDYNCLENLAAAYAETKDFEQAVRWQEKAVSLTPPAQRAVYESRLKLYREDKPFREPMPTKRDAVPSEDSKQPLGETQQ